MFINGKVNPSYFSSKQSLWGPKKSSLFAGGLASPVAQQQFDPSLRALGYLYRGTYGADPMSGLSEFSESKRRKIARRGDAPNTPEAKMRELFGYLGANPEEAAYFNSIFGQFGESDLQRLGHGARHLDPIFGEEFTSGVDRYFQERGDWEWDFGSNRWKRSASGLAKAGIKGGLASLKTSQLSTKTTPFSASNVKKETY